MNLVPAPDGYNDNNFGDFLLGDDTPRVPHKKVKVVKSPKILYNKKYDKVIEIVGKLNEVLSEYGLEADCVSGAYDPIDIQVHIGEVDKPADI